MGNAPLREGENKVVLIAVNAIGARGAPSSPRCIVLDTQPPRIDGLEPQDNVSLGDVTAIRAIVRDSTIVSPIVSGVNPDSIQVLLDDVPLPFDDPNTPEVEGCQYNPLSGQLICNAAEPFADQSTHTIQIQVADGLGNLAEASSTFTIDRSLPDVAAPVISGIAPPDRTVLNAEALAREDFALRASASDTGPGNMIIDAVVEIITNGEKNYDYAGELAAQGKPCEALIVEWLKHPFICAAPPKTTGREAFGRHFVHDVIKGAQAQKLSDAHIVSTVTEFTVRTIFDYYDRFLLPYHSVDGICVSGGGVHNLTLMQRLETLFHPIPIKSIDSYGIPSDAKEAIAFAVLANEAVHGHPGNLAQVTAASQPKILGKFVPA